MLRTAEKCRHVGRRLTHMYGRDPYVVKNAVKLPWVGAIPPVGGYTAWYTTSVPDSVFAVGGRIKLWLDLSGSGFHAYPWNAGAGGTPSGPVYGSRTINGILVPDFQASVICSLFCDMPRDDRTSSCFAVIEADTVAAGLRQIVGSDGTGGIQIRLSANDLQTVTSASLLAEQLNTVSASTPIVVGQVVSATDITQYSNTTSETDANATALTAGRKAIFGQDQVNPTQLWDGAIAEVLYFPSTLSGGDATSVVNWLKAKWGIA